MSARRGGIPGPESRTGLIRPAMSEAEFERRSVLESVEPEPPPTADPVEPAPRPTPAAPAPAATSSARVKPARTRAAKPRRVQRMFAIEEELDKKLWLYAIHVGKDRSEVVNDILRPLVASMVLYDSRDRRRGALADPEPAEPAAAAE